MKNQIEQIRELLKEIEQRIAYGETTIPVDTLTALRVETENLIEEASGGFNE